MVLRSQLPQRLQTNAAGLDADGDPRQPGDDQLGTRTGVPMSMKSGRQSATTAPPNKRLKLAGPAFKGTVRLSASQPVTHGGALALAGARGVGTRVTVVSI